MIIYYLPTGEIWNALYQSEIFKHETEPTAQEFEIDEIQENAQLCKSLSLLSTFRNSEGLGRWYVQDGELFERENWEPAT